MTLENSLALSVSRGGFQHTGNHEAPADGAALERRRRDPANTLEGCERIVVIGRTGSGKTTLARALAAALGVTHTELDSLFFDADLNTVSLPVLRERTGAAVAGERWVIDGNKSAVRDLVWPRADTLVWLDYSIFISLWRLGKRALWRTSTIQAQAAESGEKGGVPKKMFSAARGVLRALRSHMGQRRRYPKMFAMPENRHLAVVRLRSPRAASRWLARVTDGRASL